MKRLSYDLHLHSCLSPCGSEDMTPSNIAAMCALKGLDVIALTDHNSGKNCPALAACAAQYEHLTVLAGMELCTTEEVHVLCLFPTLERAMAFDALVHDTLPPVQNRPDIFGEQTIVDENERVLGEEPLLLIAGSSIGFDDVHERVAAAGGIMIPAHIDRPSNSLLSQLGFVPPDSAFHCAELHDPANGPALLEANPYLRGCTLVTNSDAHTLGDISEPVHFLEAASSAPADILAALDPTFRG